MPKFATERRVAHSPADMFALVADIEAYPKFVPLCESLKVRGRTADGEREVLIADMTVGYKAIRETFTTRVTLDRPAMEIQAEYLDGPFRHLDSHWTFTQQRRGRLRRRLRHRLRVQVAHSRRADGQRLRPRFPQVRRSLRAARR